MDNKKNMDKYEYKGGVSSYVPAKSWILQNAQTSVMYNINEGSSRHDLYPSCTLAGDISNLDIDIEFIDIVIARANERRQYLCNKRAQAERDQKTAENIELHYDNLMSLDRLPQMLLKCK